MYGLDRESYLSMASTEVVSCRDLQGRKMSDVLGTLEEAFSSARCVRLQWLLVAVVVVVVVVVVRF